MREAAGLDSKIWRRAGPRHGRSYGQIDRLCQLVIDIKLDPIFPCGPAIGRPGEGEFAKGVSYGSDGACFVHFKVNRSDPSILRNPNGTDPRIPSQAATTPTRHDLQRVCGNDIERVAVAAGGKGRFKSLLFRSGLGLV